VRRIVVLRGGAIGDLIVTEPSLRALRLAWPAARILLLGNASAGSLLVADGIIDDALSLDADWLAPLFAEDDSLANAALRRIEERLRGETDLAVAWLREPESAPVRHLSRLAGRVVAGPSVPPAGTKVHMVDHLASALQRAGIPVRDRMPRVRQAPIATEDERRRRGEASGSDIAIHPGSGGRRKNWPAERFAEVAAGVRDLGLEPIVVAGPADADATKPLRALGCRVVEPRDLLALADVLSDCVAYVGNDSGVSHLAAALGVATVAIFGPTDPRVWAPRGPRVETIWVGPEALAMPAEEALARVSVRDTLDAIRRCLS